MQVQDEKFRKIKLYYPAILVFLAVFIFSLFSFYQLKRSATARRAKLFELYASQATGTLKKRIIDYAQILRGCQSFFYASDSVTSNDWKTYFNNLKLAEHYPGIQALGYAKLIKKQALQETEQSIRQGYPHYKIKSPLKLDYLTPIIYIEPKGERNLRAFGFDMLSEENRRETMLRAVKTNLPAMTRKVILMQETNVNVQPGFLLYMPVYNSTAEINSKIHELENVKGFVYMPFRANDLMSTVLKDFDEIGIEIFDHDQPSNENLLYKSRNYNRTPREKLGQPAFEFQKDHLLNVGGNTWLIHYTADYNFGSSIERSQPQLVLIFGIAISVLLYFLTLNYIHKRQAVVDELNLTKELELKKDEFIGIASHELKTPLTSIKAYLQMLDRTPLGDKEKLFVQKASTQVNKLNSLIADLLDVSKIQAGSIKLNLTTFTLNELVSESVESVLHMYQSHEIIRPDLVPEIILTGDKLRLEQALINLLVNAIKYSPGKERVRLDIVTHENKVVLSVTDEGIGISKENQVKIFEKFYRAADLSSHFSGLGMGLFIAYEIIRRHKGTLTVESEPNRGSTFSICLPRKANL